MPSLTVDFQPIGRRVQVSPGQTLLEAAQAAGVAVVAVCGGAGLCQSCRVRLASGSLTPPTLTEQGAFSPEAFSQGYRLACQASPLSDVRIDIPPESLAAPQRLQLEGLETGEPLEPAVIPLDLTLPPPSSHDLRADLSRLADGFAALGRPAPRVSIPVVRQYSETARRGGWQVRVALHRGGSAVSVLPRGAPLFGFAADVGTTKVAAYLVSLETGQVVARAGAPNAQIAYGEDVVSRIAYANQSEAHRRTLQSRVVDTLNGLLDDLTRQAGASREQVVDAVAVGNTAMHHLFAGLPVRQLGQAPYVAAVSEPLDLPARDIGLALAPGARVYLPPNIAGFVGADHVSMLLASRAAGPEGVTLALDIGTNTEISLLAGGRVLSCSTASGPAFEGAHIHAGMRAAPGAIERVQWVGEGEAQALRYTTIDNLPPVGICGSGILDAVAEMLRGGILDERGRLRPAAPGVRSGAGGGAFVLVPEGVSPAGEIAVTRKDVNEIQLAKAAIRTGIDILLAEAGLAAEQIDHFIVAGAFGTYLHLPSAVRVGMFPPLPPERFTQVGNAAGMGAVQMLISVPARRRAQDLLRRVEYIELTTHPAFTETFVRRIGFEA